MDAVREERGNQEEEIARSALVFRLSLDSTGHRNGVQICLLLLLRLAFGFVTAFGHAFVEITFD